VSVIENNGIWELRNFQRRILYRNINFDGRKRLKMKKCIVTGGAGFIGSHVVDFLAKEGYDVMVLDNFSTGKEENLLPDRKNVWWGNVDICDDAKVIGFFLAFKPDIVIHLAAQAAITTAMQNPYLDLNTNGMGTLTMAMISKKFEVQRFIYASTSAVYGDFHRLAMDETTPPHPDNYYGVSKLAGEGYLRSTDLISRTVLRFGNVYGPRQVPIGENQVIARMMRHFYKGDDFKIFGNGKQKRDFIYVEDVARSVVAAINGKSGVYNIAGGASYSINEVAAMVAETCGVPGYRWSYDRAREDLRTNVRMRIEKAQGGLGWTPQVDMRVGLRETLDWWKKQ